jgi:L-threonylcarbamoyladenylate synthase
MHIHPWHLREAARHFHDGGLIAYPTEAVYGLGCNPLNWHAVKRLLVLKQRPLEKGLILIAASFEQLRPYVMVPGQETMKILNDSWPGPATWLLPATPDTPFWLTGRHRSLAVRVTDHPLAAALCNACRSPLVSTSANISGHPPATSPLDVRRQFGNSAAYILHGSLGSLTQPTPIRDALSGQLIRA